MNNTDLSKTNMSRLPHWVQAKVKEMAISNPEEWVTRQIPALANRSICVVAAMSNGEQILRDFFSRMPR